MIVKTISVALLLIAPVFGEYYSQLGQDEYVHQHFFKDKKNGFFLDIGAYDGITGSNTYFFEKLGWKGICFEPIPEKFEKLKKLRTCLKINACVSETPGKKEFLHIVGRDEQLSGLIDFYHPKHKNLVDRISTHKENKIEKIPVPCINLMDVLQEHHINHIDYLSLDTEGGELQILKSIDFTKVSIDVIDVENAYDNTEIPEFLKSQGYRFETRLVIDDIYTKLPSGTL